MDTKEAGKKGGLATKEKYGVEHFRKIRRIVRRKGRDNKKSYAGKTQNSK